MENQYDIILISGEYYVDHPLSGIGIITKVLRDNGYSVAIIEKPDWKDKSNKDFLKYGTPKLFFAVTSGAIDSMLQNYTPLKRPRKEDQYEPYDSKIPDRAVIVYCNRLRELFKESFIVIGGIEASMRRFVHYDYWQNELRRSILIDSSADVLVYGNGEYQIVEIANRLKNKQDAKTVDGTCVLSREIPKDFEEIPSFDNVKGNDKKNKIEFCRMQLRFSNDKNLAQKQDYRYVLQYKMHKYTTQELDYISGLNYSRDIPKYFPEFNMAQFSVITHRGCIGNCNFCSLTLHQGNKIISRSEKSILDEIKKITLHPKFKGYIDDLGGPSANMYGMDCIKCTANKCLVCINLDKSHNKMIKLLREARKIKGIKKIFIRSGIRYDLASESTEYIKEISEHHISGCLKIAPEHFSEGVLKLMNKNVKLKFLKFKTAFEEVNKKLGREQYLKYYLMTGHPGSSLKEVNELKTEIKKLKNTESIQLFTPTPMTISTCIYWTSLDPFTLNEVYVPYTYNEKKKQKNLLYETIDSNTINFINKSKKRFKDDDFSRRTQNKTRYSRNSNNKMGFKRKGFRR